MVLVDPTNLCLIFHVVSIDSLRLPPPIAIFWSNLDRWSARSDNSYALLRWPMIGFNSLFSLCFCLSIMLSNFSKSSSHVIVLIFRRLRGFSRIHFWSRLVPMTDQVPIHLVHNVLYHMCDHQQCGDETGNQIIDLWREGYYLKTRTNGGWWLHRRHLVTNERQLINGQYSPFVWKTYHTEKWRNKNSHDINIVASKEKIEI